MENSLPPELGRIAQRLNGDDAEAVRQAARALQGLGTVAAFDEAAKTVDAVARQMAEDIRYPNVDAHEHDSGRLHGIARAGERMVAALRALAAEAGRGMASDVLADRLRAIADRLAAAEGETLRRAAASLRRDYLRAAAVDLAATTAAATAKQLANDMWFPQIDTDPHTFGRMLATEALGEEAAAAIRRLAG